jgi:phosphotransferase system  glucose/maltose/N-acetylglucosamine-specific IIC component
VIGPDLADGIRLANGVGALILVALCAVAVPLADTWDQRLRFGVFAGFAALLTASHLSALGRSSSWILPALSVIVYAAVISTVAYVIRERRERELRDRRAG